jgi:lysophospholipase L1-like esterase
MSKKVRWIFFGFLFLLLSFVLAEMFFRYLYPKISPFDERIAIRYASPYTMFSKFEYGAKEPPKAEGELRIFMLGGSTVAYGNPPLPVYVERDLKRRGFQGARVFNYGVISQNSSQELAHLVFHVLDSEPDIVIIYDGGNDIMDPLLYDPRPGFPFNFLAYENNVLFKEVGEYPWPSLLAYGSEMFRHLLRNYFFETFGNFSNLRSYAGYGSHPWLEKVAGIYAGNLAKAGRICRAYNVEYVAFLQPIIFYKRKAVAETEKNILSGWPAIERNLVGPYTDVVRTKIIDDIKDEQKIFPFEFHDLSGIFTDSNEAVFTDYIHVNDASNRKIAVAICDRLSDTIRKKMGK